MSTRVKICGVVEVESACDAVALGADYLGLNFFPASPRFLDLDRAREIADAVRGRVELIGVFVDATRRTIDEAVARVGLDRVQLSGDEPPEAVAPFAACCLKAFRTGALPPPHVLAPYGPLWGVLIDAPHPTLFGGSGESWDYGRLALPASRGEERRLFLAGGLGPDNVRRAVATLRPFAVDVCSRVERSPGIKDRAKMRRFFEEVQLGWNSTSA